MPTRKARLIKAHRVLGVYRDSIPAHKDRQTSDQEVLTELIVDLLHLSRLVAKDSPNKILVEAEIAFAYEEDASAATINNWGNRDYARRLDIPLPTADLVRWIMKKPPETLPQEIMDLYFPGTARYMAVAAENRSAAHTSRLEAFKEVLGAKGVEYVPALTAGDHISYVVREEGYKATVYLYRSRYHVGDWKHVVRANPNHYSPELQERI